MIDLHLRSCGVLLHPTSLPGPHGIGDLGPEAHRFVDFLAGAGQRWWQMLPITPPGAGNSPYHTASSFAGSPWLVSPELLFREGLLSESDLVSPFRFPSDHVRYPEVIAFKERLLRRAFESFRQRPAPDDWDDFHNRSSFWLGNYASFMARNKATDIPFHEFVQYHFDRQWRSLREHATQRGIGLIGDVPIYVARDSADVSSHPELFQLDARGRPTEVAGVPPDYFSRNGQLWRNPLYRWEEHGRTGFRWWRERLRTAMERFDAVRIDHFIGFHRGWAVPARERTARVGRWLAGPGAVFFEQVLPHLPNAQLIAEDLGIVTPEVIALRERFDLPGLQVLQFCFGPGSPDRREDLLRIPRRSVVYTGTHDNDTTVGWFRSRGGRSGPRSTEQVLAEREKIKRLLQTDPRRVHEDLIRLAFESNADTAIIPAQDWLGLGSEARMNTPGTRKGNWEWRLDETALSRGLSDRLRSLASSTNRIPSDSMGTP